MKKVFLILSLFLATGLLQSCSQLKRFNGKSAAVESKAVEHIVFVWLKEGYSPKDLTLVIRESKALKAIPGIKGMKLGRALQSDRAIVDDSFQVGIIMSFASVAEMKEYLIHPDHVRRVKETLKPLSSKIVVYDILPE